MQLTSEPEAADGEPAEEAPAVQLNLFGEPMEGEQVSLFPSEAQQIRSIAEAESAEKTPFAFSIPQEDINQVLRFGSNTENSRMRVAAKFMKQKSPEEIAAFLQKEYHGGYGVKGRDGDISAWYAQDGIHLSMGLSARYGYQKSANGRMEPDTESAEVVRQIFQLAADGNSAAAIARHLTAQHIPTPGEHKAGRGNHTYDISRAHGVWNSSTILRMLDDERYTGTYVIGKKTVVEVGSNHVRQKDREKWYIIPDHHPAIMDQETFDAAQAKLARFKLPNKKTHEYPLKGKVFCGCCRHALSRTSNKTS